MKQLSDLLLEAGKTSTTEPRQELEKAPSQQPPESLKATKEDEDRITRLLFTLSLTQNTYGLHPDDIPSKGKAYAWALKGYTYRQIYDAVKGLIKKKDTIPTPSEIIAVIEASVVDYPALPPINGWILDIANEIGAIPARSWFGNCRWDGETLFCPNQFFEDFISQNYERVLLRVLGPFKIAVEPD